MNEQIQLTARSGLTTTGADVELYTYTVDCEQNGDTSKHWAPTGPTASLSICHGDDNQWADIYEEEIVQLHCDFPLNGYPASVYIASFKQSSILNDPENYHPKCRYCC